MMHSVVPDAAGTGSGPFGGLTSLVRRMPVTVWPFLAFILLFILGGIMRSSLFTLVSLWGVLAFAMIMALASAGQTIVIVQGGFDLSVANTITVSALTLLTQASHGAAVAVLSALAVGAMVGLANGIGVSYLRISPIVMTIATNGFLFGVILLAFDMSQLADVPQAVSSLTAGKLSILGTDIPGVILVGLVVLLILQFIMMRTGLGRSLYLIGSAPTAAEFMGIPVQRIRVVCYTVAGLLSALAAVVITGFFGQTSIDMGNPYLLGSVAAVVVGGASIFGGSGSPIGTLGGALVLGQVSTLVAVLNLSSEYQQIIYGGIILIVVGIYGRRAIER